MRIYVTIRKHNVIFDNKVSMESSVDNGIENTVNNYVSNRILDYKRKLKDPTVEVYIWDGYRFFKLNY